MDTTTTNGFDMATFLNTAMNRANEDGFGNNSFLWIILLFLLFGQGGFGWGNRNNAATELAGTEAIEAAINKSRANELSDQTILEAVNGNRTAISEIANTLGVNQSALMTALNQLSTGVQSVSNQIGLTSQQIINAIQLGNQNLGQQLMSCCCENKNLIIDKANAAIIQNMQQTTELKGTIEAGFALMGNRFNEQAAATTAGFQQIKDMFNQSKIDSLQEKVTQLQNAQNNAAQTAAITGYVQAAVTPLQNAVNVLYERSTPAPIPAYVVANPNGTVPSCTGA